MKRKHVLLVVASLFLVIFGTSAQDYPKPMFKNQPMALNDGKLVKLEKAICENKMKVQGLGWGGVQQEISATGGSSPVRTSKTPEFLIWVDEGVDPETIFVLTKTIPTKKLRNIPVSKSSAFAGYGARGKSMTGKYQVKCSFEHVGEGLFLIKPVEKLEDKKTDEYAFYNPEKTSAKQLTVFLFGVK